MNISIYTYFNSTKTFFKVLRDELCFYRGAPSARLARWKFSAFSEPVRH